MAQPELVDVVVVGLGVGGEEVAGRLAEAGLTVVGIERDLVGGECPYWGCVPSKMMIRGSTLIAETRRADPYAGRSSIETAPRGCRRAHAWIGRASTSQAPAATRE